MDTVSRPRKLQVVTRIAKEFESLLAQLDPDGAPNKQRKDDAGDAAVRWRAAAENALRTIGVGDPWLSIVSGATFAPFIARQELLGLYMLRWRIEDDLNTALSPEDDARRRLSSLLAVHGEFIVHRVEGRRGGIPIRLFPAFDAFAKGGMDAAVREAGPLAPAAAECIAYICRETAADAPYTGLPEAEQWHVGWALLTLAWHLAEAGGFAITVSRHRLCALEHAVISRFLLHISNSAVCPKCGAVLRPLQDPRKFNYQGPLSPLFECDTCRVSICFPRSAREGSIWSVEPEVLKQAKRIQSGAESAPAPSPPSTQAPELPDLAWMKSQDLRRVVAEDFVNLARCVDAGAWKAAALLGGSACEGMLLDVLERNTAVAKTYVGKPEHFPDRMSLDQMLEAAKDKGLLRDLALHLAPALRAHRDMIHPNRSRREGEVTKDHAGAVAHLAQIVATELLAASQDGRIDAFVAE